MSENISTPDLVNPLSEDFSITALSIGLYTLVFLLALGGNGLMLVSFLQHRSLRTITNVFLLNLAIGDILLALVCIPFTLIPILMRNFMFGQAMCVIIRYLQGESIHTVVGRAPFLILYF